jgi:hypothetical protein
VVLMFVAFLRETYPTEVTALTGGVALLLVLGRSALRRGARGAVEPGALDHRGDVHRHGGAGAHRRARLVHQAADPGADTGPAHRAGGADGFVVVASAFVNNTPVVVVMIPVFTQLARRSGSRPRNC